MNLNTAEFEAAYGTFSQLPVCDLPEIAFSGKSNVGKSSLLNKLFNRKSLARISSVPGKTITINFYNVGDARFADLPGYGYAKVSKTEKNRWAEMLEGYFRSNRDIRLVVQLIDMRHSPSKDDLMMIDFLIQMDFKFIVVMTKSDKLNKTEYKKRVESVFNELPNVSPDNIIAFSAVNGEGREKIIEKIINVL